MIWMKIISQVISMLQIWNFYKKTKTRPFEQNMNIKKILCKYFLIFLTQYKINQVKNQVNKALKMYFPWKTAMINCLQNFIFFIFSKSTIFFVKEKKQERNCEGKTIEHCKTYIYIHIYIFILHSFLMLISKY